MRHKANIRQYMDFVRDLATESARKPHVSVSRIAQKHGVSKCAGVAMKEIGYIRCASKHRSRWNGPVISDEVTLRKAAVAVKVATSKYQKRIKAANGTPAQSLLEVPTPAPKQKEAPKVVAPPPAMPRVARAKVRKVSILWGLISWTR
jgi:hypothetical protein